MDMAVGNVHFEKKKSHQLTYKNADYCFVKRDQRKFVRDRANLLNKEHR